MSGYPKIIHTEEGMRDGLQIESPDITVDAKVRLLDALSETGLKEIARSEEHTLNSSHIPLSRMPSSA